MDPRTFPPLTRYLSSATGQRGRPRVLILVAPFGDLSAPFLGPSLLVAACRKRHMDCHALYANLVFAAAVGQDRYQRFLNVSTPLVRESLFAPYAFGADRDELIQMLLRAERSPDPFGRDFYGSTESLSVDEFLECDKLVPAFLEYVVQNVLEAAPDVLGFSLLSGQNTASLAIAKRVKEDLPEVVTVAGGNNVARPMGNALLAASPMIDYVFSGQADEDFPRFCADLADKKPPAPGVIDCVRLDHLDRVEIPDHSDYFQQLGALHEGGVLPGGWPQALPFETSRGCSWGERCQCAFCGLNAHDIVYLEKTKERIATELRCLKDQYDVDFLHAIDNVVPDGVEDILHETFGADERVVIFYELRSNISPSRLDALVRNGVVLSQPGIESLSTNILRRMRKGVTALENLRFLRETSSRQILLVWNFLVEVPGETREDYESILGILPLIEHFTPPISLGPIHLHRYSPYVDDPARFGIRNLKPLDAYASIYPAGTNLDDLAFHFSGEYESVFSTDREIREGLTDQVSRWVQLWWDAGRRPRLARVQGPGGVAMIMDTRTVARQAFTALDDESNELLETLNDPLRGEAIPGGLRARLPELLDRHFVLFHEDHYLSIVTDPLIGVTLRRQRKASFFHTSSPGETAGRPPRTNSPTEASVR